MLTRVNRHALTTARLIATDNKGPYSSYYQYNSIIIVINTAIIVVNKLMGYGYYWLPGLQEPLTSLSY